MELLLKALKQIPGQKNWYKNSFKKVLHLHASCHS